MITNLTKTIGLVLLVIAMWDNVPWWGWVGLILLHISFYDRNEGII